MSDTKPDGPKLPTPAAVDAKSPFDPAEEVYKALFGPGSPKSRHFDVERIAYLLAAVSSAQFFLEHFRMAPNLRSTGGLLKHAAKCCSIEGLNLEFGVNSGTTIRILSEAMKVGDQMPPFHGFDSFEGLPEDWTHFQKAGRFGRQGKLPPVPDTVTLHVGWFNEILPGFLQQHAGPARFIHIDSDLYSSAKTVLTLLADRIVPGTVIVFDEYFNYPGWEQHEHKAWTEFVASHGVEFEYVGWASAICSVAVKVTKIWRP